MNTILGGHIKELRESKKLTQEYLAERLGCTRQRYARIERGESDISYSLLCDISVLLGVDVKNITEVLDAPRPLTSLFRIGDHVEDKSMSFVMDMLDTFFAHKKIYDGVRRVE
jgi:transcriptional regulator with XRE-family HTH domain